MKIRKAEITDAEGIAKVHVDSWKTTYKNIVGNLKDMDMARII